MSMLAGFPTIIPDWYAPTPVYGTVVYVHGTGNVDTNGANLQAAIDAAATADDGRTIVLDQGVEYRGSFWDGEFILKAHASTTPITICTDGFQTGSATFPVYGECIEPGDGANLAVLTSLETLPGVIQRTTLLIPYGVHYWNLRGIRIKPNVSHQYPIVKVGGYNASDLDDYGTDVDEIPHHIVFDRVLIDPSATWEDPNVVGHHFTNYTACLQLNGHLCQVVGCHIEVYDVTGQGDYKCLESAHGTYNLIEDCKLWGGGETLFLGGGGGPTGPGEKVTPTHDWLIRRSVIGKDHTAMKVAGWLSKNVLETKGATNIAFVGCLIDANQTVTGDTGQQRMFAAVCYPGGEDAIYYAARNISFTDCIIKRGYGWTLQRKFYLGQYGEVACETYSYDNTLFYRFRTNVSFFTYWYGVPGVSFTHCTLDLYDATSAVEPYTAFIMVENQQSSVIPSTPFTGFVLRDSIIAGAYLRLLANNGELGEGYFYNNDFYTEYLTGNSPTLTNNLWLAVGTHDGTPANLFNTHFTTLDAGPNWDGRNDADYRTTVLTDADAGDYRIQAGQPYKAGGARDATDGKDLGVDYAQMETTMGARVWAAANLGF